ncbi:hypothetical protein Dimus_011463 [Dionaea muscipula]
MPLLDAGERCCAVREMPRERHCCVAPGRVAAAGRCCPRCACPAALVCLGMKTTAIRWRCCSRLLSTVGRRSSHRRRCAKSGADHRHEIAESLLFIFSSLRLHLLSWVTADASARLLQ